MKIGFIGLGIMGKPMAKNLLKAGFEVVAYTHKQATIDELVSCGAEAGTSGADLAGRCDAIVTMLPNSPNVRDAVFGKNGIVEGAHEGLVLIDMSSIDPTESKKIAAELEKKGIDMIDAPVSGGEPMAVAGTLSIEKLEAMTAVCSVGLDMICIPGDTPADTISAIIADEAAIGMVNCKTTAVRVIPAIGKDVGEELDWGGLFGRAPVMPLKKESPSKFINRGGQIPAPLHSLKN